MAGSVKTGVGDGEPNFRFQTSQDGFGGVNWLDEIKTEINGMEWRNENGLRTVLGCRAGWANQ